jgi:hypothetical protein
VNMKRGTASADGAQNFVEFKDGFSSQAQWASCARAFVPIGVRVVTLEMENRPALRKGN